jgi:serine/threonine protein phosphatase PrpC
MLQVAANAALYSRKLMHHAYLELERFDNVDDPCFYHYDEADPVSILQKSYEESMQEAQQEVNINVYTINIHTKRLQGIIGSCTACLAILRHEELRIANLGDCGISVIRHNDYIFRSEEQQHSFNFPYQLGTSSPDKPKDAQVDVFDIDNSTIKR